MAGSCISGSSEFSHVFLDWPVLPPCSLSPPRRYQIGVILYDLRQQVQVSELPKKPERSRFSVTVGHWQVELRDTSGALLPLRPGVSIHPAPGAAAHCTASLQRVGGGALGAQGPGGFGPQGSPRAGVPQGVALPTEAAHSPSLGGCGGRCLLKRGSSRWKGAHASLRCCQHFVNFAEADVFIKHSFFPFRVPPSKPLAHGVSGGLAGLSGQQRWPPCFGPDWQVCGSVVCRLLQLTMHAANWAGPALTTTLTSALTLTPAPCGRVRACVCVVGVCILA